MLSYNGRSATNKSGSSLGRLQFGPPPSEPKGPPAQPTIVQSVGRKPARKSLQFGAPDPIGGSGTMKLTAEGAPVSQEQ